MPIKTVLGGLDSMPANYCQRWLLQRQSQPIIKLAAPPEPGILEGVVKPALGWEVTLPWAGRSQPALSHAMVSITFAQMRG